MRSKVGSKAGSKPAWAVLAAAVVLAAGCGGGGGGGGSAAASGVTTGTITGFGSVIINGVRYRTSGTTEFEIDDNPGGQDHLAVGQQVTIRWTSADGGRTRDAVRVKYDDTVEGAITAIDLGAGTLVVLGQQVQTGAGTSFDDDIPGRTLAGLVVGDRIEVSGLVDANGVIQATRIERDDDDDEFEIRGIVSGLDAVARTFVINGLTVDYSGVNAPSGLADGAFVEVEGDDFDAGTVTLVASKVELEDDDRGRGRDDDDDDDDDVEVEGFITRFVSATDFDVNGRPVTTTSRTRYDDGRVGDLALNVRVEVEGVIDASGVLVAREVDFEGRDDDDDARRAEIEDVITAIPAPDTIVAGGVTIRLTSRTRFEDHGDDRNQSLNAAALRVGDYVEVKGRVATGNEVEATRLERDDDEDDASLRGPVTAIAAPNLSILGVEVVTNGSTDFEDDDGDNLSADQFFARLAPGEPVKASFDLGAEPRVAREVEFESGGDDDDNDDDDDNNDDD